MNELFSNFIHRSGTFDYPAFTCRDLMKQFPGTQNGKYQLDSNGGSFDDQFSAECTRGTYGIETCINIKQQAIKMENILDKDLNESVLLSKLIGKEVSNAFEYEPSRSQLNSLIEKHEKASQYLKIQFNCNQTIQVEDLKKIKIFNTKFIQIPNYFIQAIYDSANCFIMLKLESLFTDYLPIGDLIVETYFKSYFISLNISKVCFF